MEMFDSNHTGLLITVSAPGRVNLLGEHTDYNDGFVLPSPLIYHTTLQATTSERIEVFATNLQEHQVRELDQPKQNNWLDYIAGCVQVLRQAGYPVKGIKAVVNSDVPMSSGLSSSAALEVATLRAMRMLYQLDIDDVTIAKLAQQAEVEYVGVRCGIMDQFASSVGRLGYATMLDTQSLVYQNQPLPQGYKVVVVDSSVPRRLAESGYNTRRSECEQACQLLGVSSLRDLTMADIGRIATLPEPLGRRAKHVVTENDRVLRAVEALQKQDFDTFGALMIASHQSLAHDYEVSVPELNQLVDIMLAHGAVGARLTGAGFGGATVALVKDSLYDQFVEGVCRDYPKAVIL